MEIEDLTKYMRRIRVCGDMLRHLKVEFPGQWMKVFFPLSEDAAIAGGKAHGRAYTIRSHDASAGLMDLDFVLHGDEGLASRWAGQARVGETLSVAGPREGYKIDPIASHHLLIGDSTALPAICDILETLPADASGWTCLEINDIDETSLLPRRPGFVSHANGSADAWPQRSQRVLSILSDIALPASVQAFVAGEASMVREVREYLRNKGVPRSAVSASGYWRVGAEDHRDAD